MFHINLSYGFLGNVVLVSHGIGPWYCNKLNLQVKTLHNKVGDNIHSQEFCYLFFKYIYVENSYINPFYN